MKLTIITPCFNSTKTILHCIKSVRTQSRHANHIVIDGQSNDGTVDLLRREPIHRFISEPDSGVYDAMNKGIRLLDNGIVGILNADDYYAHSNVLEKVADVFENSDIDSCYGDLVYVDHENGEKILRYWKAGEFNYRNFFWGWMPPHPTFFVRHRAYRKYGLFNTVLGTAADYELMLRFMVRHRITSVYIPEVLVKMRIGGMSSASIHNRLKANKMDRHAWKINGLRPYPWSLYLKPIRKIGQFYFKPKNHPAAVTYVKR